MISWLVRVLLESPDSEETNEPIFIDLHVKADSWRQAQKIVEMQYCPENGRVIYITMS